MIIYGTMMCPDCVQCRSDLDASGIVYEFREISQDLRYLKEFLKIRDTNVLFAGPKEEGMIGIPYLVLEDGTVSLTWK